MKKYLKRDIIICIFQIIVVYNATILGWSVKKINNNTYEFTKQINKTSVDINKFVEQILYNTINI